jgi:hypothetical protein
MGPIKSTVPEPGGGGLPRGDVVDARERALNGKHHWMAIQLTLPALLAVLAKICATLLQEMLQAGPGLRPKNWLVLSPRMQEKRARADHLG